MTRSPNSGSSSFFCTVLLPAHPFAKNMLTQLLRKSLPLLFISFYFGGLTYPPSLQARPTVGFLSVDIHYPSKGLNWLGIFLQEELPAVTTAGSIFAHFSGFHETLESAFTKLRSAGVKFH